MIATAGVVTIATACVVATGRRGCSVLQCVAVCCRVVRCVVGDVGVGEDAVCCSVVQCVAVCGRVLQRVAGGVRVGEDADPLGDRECCNSFSGCCSWS